MGVDMELEFDKYCKVGRSPRTVLPAPRHQSKNELRSSKGKRSSGNGDYDLLHLQDKGFTEIKFRNYRSVSCKNLPSGDVELECSEVVRRNSVYQTSREKIYRPETRCGRKKIEFSLGDENSFSFSILDSICGSDEEVEAEPEQNGSSIPSLGSDEFSSTEPPRKPCSLVLRERASDCGKSAERNSMDDRKFLCQEVSGPSSSADVLKQRDFLALNKSLSAKLAMPHSPTHSEGNSSKSSPKSRFTPIRKMFDPLTKSKCHRNPSVDTKSSGLTGIGKATTLQKSLLQDFSIVEPNVEADTHSVKKEQQQVTPTCSAAHLQGSIKMEQKHRVPFFEFSMAHSNDVFVAKAWKAEDALNWVYTFHSVHRRKKSNATGWGMRYSNKDSPIVAQMQVRCLLCSELRDGGAFSNSMMTEFVLYDIEHARKSASVEIETNSPDISKDMNASREGSVEGNVELDDLFDLAKPRLPMTCAVDHISTDFSTPYPDLHPNLEIAAIVVQAPFEKRESLKYKTGDKLSNKTHSTLLDLSSESEGRKGIRYADNMVKVNVVAPLGNHSLPNSGEGRGPSPLLDRWRLGGGCECGGWDMACPLVVFGNRNTQCTEENSLLQKNQPLKLYVKGGKENLPALTITVSEKGQYNVDFHAQLSTLQAFAVCVAILHTTEASSLVEQEKNKHLLQCSSMKVPVEDEVKTLIEAVTEEEKKKLDKTARENPNPPAFVLNPPFSPIARV